MVLTPFYLTEKMEITSHLLQFDFIKSFSLKMHFWHQFLKKKSCIW